MEEKRKRWIRSRGGEKKRKKKNKSHLQCA